MTATNIRPQRSTLGRLHERTSGVTSTDRSRRVQRATLDAALRRSRRRLAHHTDARDRAQAAIDDAGRELARIGARLGELDREEAEA